MKSKLMLAALTVALMTPFGMANAADGEAPKNQVAPHSHVAEKGGYSAPAKGESVNKTEAPSTDKAKTSKNVKNKVAKHSHTAEKGGYSAPAESAK